MCRLEYLGFVLEYLGFVLEYLGFVLEYLGLVLEYLGLVLEYLGLVVRVDGERSVKTLMEGTAGEERIKGRWRLRWTEDVELYPGNIVLKSWRS